MPKWMNQPGESTRNFAVWLLALFLAAFGAQLWVVWLYGSPVPIWDQWYEAGSLFSPWMAGHLTFGDLVAADSNHRIVLTRLLDLCIIRFNGRWDPLLQMTVNAFFHAAFACGLAFCLWHFFGRKRGWLVCFLLMPFFTMPYAGENAIWGINSMWYFANIFALATVVGLGFGKAGSWQWWFGLVAAVMGLLTMASGLLAPMTAGGLILLRAIKNRRIEREKMIGLGACLLLAGLGAPFIATPEYNRPLLAHSFSEFTSALAHNLSWPFFNAPEMACVIALPPALLLVFYLRPNFQASRAAEFILALALWSVLQSVAVAYGRANYVEVVPASRYMDLFSVLVIASLFATVLLGQMWERGRVPGFNGTWLPLIFAGVMFFGLCRISQTVVEDVLVVTREWNLIAEERVQTFMATGKEQDLFEQPTVQPDPKVTLGVLRDPNLRAILPAACFPPASSPAPGRFTPASQWLLRHSIMILSCGLILFAGLCGLGLARGNTGLMDGNPARILALLACLAALGFVWSQRSLQRQSVERDLQQQLAAYFKSAGKPDRAAIHQHKADELKSAE
jgi:hypothetical protein